MTKEEILEKVYKEYRISHPASGYPEWSKADKEAGEIIYPAMEEYATHISEAKDKRIKELEEEIEYLKSLTEDAVRFGIDNCRPFAETDEQVEEVYQQFKRQNNL